MKKPVFVVLRKYFALVNGVYTPFTTDSADVEIYESFEEAKASVIRWAESMGKDQYVFCDYGVLSRAAEQCGNLVFCVSVSRCFSRYFVDCVADIYQRHVL